MESRNPEVLSSSAVEPGRREAVLESALETFGRFGYRKTSMEEVARAAHISRPGLYFLFSSKQDLFRAAVAQALEADVSAAESLLADEHLPLRDRLLGAFDRWTGRYIGALARDVSSVVEENPELLGTLTVEYPIRFAGAVTSALATGLPAVQRGDAEAIAQTLGSVSVGIKYQVSSREDFLARLGVAIDLLVR
ncbi:TetR/AcrR family transcriptional regulator [Glaciihabitans sp. dw_435]|uniref:TetR/AcrR family transcriptional regulator n=1 Tax=Glaciihabitans sp. dw_435 TaxID=2720081 RepID=UPI001BD2EEBE|nr:TetR/AcrR family transcriptional regulator [Glaciihabitans sp. dw_435]